MAPRDRHSERAPLPRMLVMGPQLGLVSGLAAARGDGRSCASGVRMLSAASSPLSTLTIMDAKGDRQMTWHRSVSFIKIDGVGEAAVGRCICYSQRGERKGCPASDSPTRRV